MDEILFQITTKHLENGMRGVPMGYCTLSRIDALQGLLYREKPIESFIDLSMEEVIYFLYFGRLPKKEEKDVFMQQMTARYFISSGAIRLIRSLPTSVSPIKLFASALLILGMYEATGDYKKDCLNVIGKLPVIVAEVINHHAGWGETPQIVENCGYIDNLLYRLQTPRGERSLLHQIFSLYVMLYCDIGGTDLTTFVGKTVASGKADIYDSLSAAGCSIGGGEEEEIGLLYLEHTRNILQHCREDITKERISQCVQSDPTMRKQIEPFYSLQEDTRATIFYRFAEEYFSTHPLIKVAKLLREVMIGILYKEKHKSYYPSIGTISSAVLQVTGFPYCEYYPVLFGLSRCIGTAVQIVYERCDARNGMGMPMIQPRYLYRTN